MGHKRCLEDVDVHMLTFKGGELDSESALVFPALAEEMVATSAVESMVMKLTVNYGANARDPLNHWIQLCRSIKLTSRTTTVIMLSNKLIGKGDQKQIQKNHLFRKQVLSNGKFPKGLEIVDEKITAKDSDAHPRSEFRIRTGSKVGKCWPVSIRNKIEI